MANNVTATILSPIIQYILQPAYLLILSFAVVVFIWGVAQLIFNQEDSEKRLDAQRHILWGVIGLFIMLAVYGIIRFVGNSLGVQIPMF